MQKSSKKGVMAKSFIETFKSIKKSPFIFTALFIMQLVFIAVSVTIFMFFAFQIMQHMNNIIEGMSLISQNNSTSDPFAMFSSMAFADDLAAVEQNLILLLLFFYVAYLVLNSVNWNLTNMMVTKFVNFVHHTATFGLLTLIFVAPAIILLNVALDFLINSLNMPNTFKVITIIVLIVASYFMFVSFALIPFYKFVEFWKLVKKTFLICFNDFAVLAPTFAIALIVSSIPFILLYKTYETGNIIFPIISILLIALCMNWARLFLVTTVKELVHSEK